MKRHLTPIAALLAVGCSACLYVPPLHHTAGVGTVDALGAQPTKSRSDVEHGLGGKAEVLRKQGLYVYDWEQSHGHLVFAGLDPGSNHTELTGRHFRALVSFDGDRVVRYEHVADRSAKGEQPQRPPAVEPDRLWKGCSEKVRCMQVAVAEGDRLVALDREGNLWAWDDDAARLIAPKPTDEGRRLFEPLLAVSPDGRYAAFGRHLDTVLFDLRDRREVVHAVRTGSGGWGISPRPTGFLFSRDGSVLTVVGVDPQIQRIGVGTGQAGEIVSMSGPSIVASALVPGTTRLLTTDIQGSLGYVDVQTGEREPPLVRAKSWSARRLVIAPEGRHVALVTGPALEWWDLEQLERERDAAPPDTSPTFTDGRATRALRGVQLLPFPAIRPACEAATVFTPDGRSLAVVVGDRIGLFPADGGPATRWFAVPGQSLCGLAFSRDGSRLFSTTPAGLAEWTIRPEAQ